MQTVYLETFLAVAQTCLGKTAFDLFCGGFCLFFAGEGRLEDLVGVAGINFFFSHRGSPRSLYILEMETELTVAQSTHPSSLWH